MVVQIIPTQQQIPQHGVVVIGAHPVVGIEVSAVGLHGPQLNIGNLVIPVVDDLHGISVDAVLQQEAAQALIAAVFLQPGQSHTVHGDGAVSSHRNGLGGVQFLLAVSKMPLAYHQLGHGSLFFLLLAAVDQNGDFLDHTGVILMLQAVDHTGILVVEFNGSSFFFGGAAAGAQSQQHNRRQ